jgi:hypothetical protein
MRFVTAVNVSDQRGRETHVTKRVTILSFVLAVAGFGFAAPASAQNACFLQGAYVFNLTIVPGPAAGIGTLVFTPPGVQNCILGVPGSVTLTTTLFGGEVTTAYFVQGSLLTIPLGSIVLQGLLGQFEGGIARSFVYHSLGGDGVVVTGTGLHAANSPLQAALDTEIAQRQAADTALQAAVNELTAQGRAFQTLKDRADLVNGAPATVATLGPLPAGSYVVIVKATVVNRERNAFWVCSLFNPVDLIDTTSSDTKSSNTVMVHVALTTLTAPGSLEMFCGTGEAGSSLSHIVMTAVRVTDITTLP